MSRFDENGHELPDPTPVEVPLRFRNHSRNLQEQIKLMVQGELSRQAAEAGQETFEEADDFDVGDDYDPRSPYELDQEQMQFNHQKDPPIQDKNTGKGKPDPEGPSAGPVAAPKSAEPSTPT